MAEEAENGDELDVLLSRVEAGAKAGGAKPYLLDYINVAKRNIFDRLAAAPPTLEGLTRVWGAAVGIAELERDLTETITDGRDARIVLNGPRTDPGQAEDAKEG